MYIASSTISQQLPVAFCNIDSQLVLATKLTVVGLCFDCRALGITQASATGHPYLTTTGVALQGP
jgi:hypothetical protein